MIHKPRIFNGKKYFFSSAEYYKFEAITKRDYLMKRGYNVRIVKSKKKNVLFKYILYKRKK